MQFRKSMELSDLIPDGSDAWKVGKRQLTYKKYANIPICYIEDDVAYVYLDKRIYKQVLQLTRRLMDIEAEFYFTTPELSSPKGLEDHYLAILHNYLRSYIQKEFSRGFNRLGFDIIRNMTDWAKKEGCFSLIRESYESVKLITNRKDYDHYGRFYTYEYSQEIRDDYERLYREIQINSIL